VELESAPGRGCAVTIRLPLTLAIIRGFAVGVGDQVLLMPLGAVQECLDRPSDHTRDAGVLNLRGRPLGCVRLSTLLGWSRVGETRESVVVVSHAGSLLGLIVDTVYGEMQTVIKPLGRPLRQIAGLAGATILGDGRVALILDVATLVRQGLRREAGRDARRATISEPGEQRETATGSA
jgi:two-component system chemotaxis sensor kinase CheA